MEGQLRLYSPLKLLVQIMLNPPNQSGKPQEYNQQKNQNPKSFPNPKSVPAAQSTAATSNPNSSAVGKTNAAVKIEEV